MRAKIALTANLLGENVLLWGKVGPGQLPFKKIGEQVTQPNEIVLKVLNSFFMRVDGHKLQVTKKSLLLALATFLGDAEVNKVEFLIVLSWFKD